MNVGELFVKILGDTKGLDSALKKSETNLQKFQKSAAKIGTGLTMGLTLPIVGIGVAIVKAASDAEETAGKFNTVFSEMATEAQDAADVLSESFGLSGQKAQELLGNTGDLLTGFGFTQDAALDLSSQVNQLAVDLASFTNYSGGAEGASAALTKALLGERESIKNLGISILEVDVKAKILENTQNGLTFETERQAKAFATLELAQIQSKNAIGDFARTEDSLANQMRTLKADIQDFAVSMGEFLIPIIKDIVGHIKGWVEKLNEMSDGKKRAILRIAAFAAAVGPAVLVVGKLVTVVKAATVALKAMGAAQALTPIGLAAMAIGAVALGVKALIDWQKKARGEASLHAIALRAQAKAALEVKEAFVEIADKEVTVLELEISGLEIAKKDLEALIKQMEDIASGKTRDVSHLAISMLEKNIAAQKLYVASLEESIEKQKESTEVTVGELTAREKIVAALRLEYIEIDKHAAAVKEMGIETDVAAEKNAALEEALIELADAGYRASSAWTSANIEEFYQETGDLAEEDAEARRLRFEEQILMINQLNNEQRAEAAEHTALMDARATVEEEYTAKLIEQTGDRLAILSYEREQAIAAAEAIGADTLAIREYYSKEATKILKEQADEQFDVMDTFAKMGKDIYEEFITSIVGQLELLGQSLSDTSMATLTFGEAMKDIGIQILHMLPQLLLMAGLQLCATPAWPVGIGLIVAAGGAALLSGYVKGIDESSGREEHEYEGYVWDEPKKGDIPTSKTIELPEDVEDMGGLDPIRIDISIDGAALDATVQDAVSNRRIIINGEDII